MSSGGLFVPVWFPGSEELHQGSELVLAAALGVLAYYVPLCIVRRQRSARGMMLLGPTAQAVAAGLILFSCFGMVEPHFSSMARIGVPSPNVLYFLGGAAAGGGLFVQVHHFFGDTHANAATTAMLAHGVAEGAALGLLSSSPDFYAIFRSQVFHGVPDGMLLAMVSVERSGLARALLSAVLARSGQAVAFYATAVYAPPVSKEVLWAGEGVALGSLVAMAWEELVVPAVGGLGRKKAAALISVTASACFFLFN